MPFPLLGRHGLERVPVHSAAIAAHWIHVTADREPAAYRAVVTAEQEVKCASVHDPRVTVDRGNFDFARRAFVHDRNCLA